jgi:hypothetical protein
MVEQQQKRSPGLATLAAVCLTSLLALYGLIIWFLRSCSTVVICGLAPFGPIYWLIGTGTLFGIAAWLGVTLRAGRRHDVPSALSIGLLPLVALSNALLVGRHSVGSLASAGAWALFSVLPVTLLAISLTRRQSIQRVVAVAGLVLAIAVLVASNLVNY